MIAQSEITSSPSGVDDISMRTCRDHAEITTRLRRDHAEMCALECM